MAALQDVSYTAGIAQRVVHVITADLDSEQRASTLHDYRGSGAMQLLWKLMFISSSCGVVCADVRTESDTIITLQSGSPGCPEVLGSWMGCVVIYAAWSWKSTLLIAGSGPVGLCTSHRAEKPAGRWAPWSLDACEGKLMS